MSGICTDYTGRCQKYFNQLRGEIPLVGVSPFKLVFTFEFKLLEQSDENQIKDLLRMKLSEQGYSLLIALELGNDLSSLSYVQIDAQGNITAVITGKIGEMQF